MAIFTKAIIGSAVAGTIALGAMVTYDGGSTVDSAKNKITEAGQQIGVFKSNETKLVGKVNLLKTEKAELTAQVADLEVQLATEKAKNTTDNERINQLEAEIETLNAQIAELETEIETANASLENSAGNTAATVERINALEAELNEANEKSEELQYTLDTTVFASPDQTAVDAALSGSEPVVEDEPADDGGTGGDGGGTAPIVNPINMVLGTPVELANLLVMDKEEIKNTAGDLIGYQIRVTNNQAVGKDSYDLTVDGQAYTLTPGSNVVIGMATDLNGKVLTVDNAFMELATFTLINK